MLSQAANKRLDELATRHEELSKKVQAGHDANAMRELHGLDDVLERRRALAAATSELDDLRELLDDADADIRAEAERELDKVKATVEALEAALKAKLAPGDATDASNSCLVEIRAAAGGDEASVFAKDLLGMYEKFCQAKGWRFAAHDVRRTEFGGVASAMAEVTGEGCYAALRFESGVHRVQRVPTNDVRIHTSTAPDARNVSMRTSSSSNVNSIWSTPGRTTTDAVDVWILTSFVGTRWTRCTPLSKRSEA